MMDFRFFTKILSFNPICVSCVCASFIIWQHYFKTKRNNFKITFFNPLRRSCCNCANTYNADCSNADCTYVKTTEIAHRLQNATKSIDICVFAISNEQIAFAVIAAHKRGVLVRIVVSNCVLMNGKEIKLFRSCGIEFKYQNDEKTFMHNKFCLIDSTWLIHCSMNWTRQATEKNWESFLITDSPCLISEYSNAFEHIWLNIFNN